MQQLGAQDGTLAKAGAQGIGGTVQLFLFIGFGWIGEKIQLLKIVGAGLFGAHPNKAHWAVGPHLAHQLPRGVVNHIGRVGGAVQRYLVAAAAEGVIHQLMYEKHKQNPGDIVCIADSHTGTCGGYGQIGIGVGSTELAAAMATGTLDLEVPQVVQIYLTGKRPSNVFGKDLILYLGSKFGSDYLVDRGLLLTGPGIDDLSIAERMTVCNMGIEIGSMITIFGTEEKESDCFETYEIDLSTLEPQISCPFSPANVVPVREKAGIKVTQVVVGSCTNGRLNDMEQVAKAFKGKKVSPDVNVLIVPASREILGQMEERGWTKIIRDAGATILNPGCGSCFGAHEGLITPRDVCVSTTNRNFPGRMGSKVGQIYLASPATAAATALTGVITVPEV